MVDQGQLGGGASNDFNPSLGGSQRSAAWRALQAEGIIWDGPVLVTGGGSEIPLRLIITSQRLAFTKGGAFVLDVERAWLSPPPQLLPDGAMGITIAPEDGGRPERLRLVVRDGRRTAADLLAAFNRAAPERPVYPSRPQTMPIYVPEPVAEVPEPPMARGRRSAPPVEPVELAPVRAQRHDLTEQLPPLAVEPEEGSPDQDSLLEVDPRPRKAEWALQPISKLTPRSSRRKHRTWVIRLSGLLLLLALATAFGTGRLPDVPGEEFASRIAQTSIEAPFSGDDPTPTSEPELAQEIPPTPTAMQPASTATVRAATRDGSLIPTVPPSRTAVALGVGGESPPAETTTPEPTATPEPEPTATATASPEPTATPEPEPTSTTAPVRAAEDGAAPAPEPTSTPAPEPTATPEPEPTATPEPEPTATATAEPTATPELEPTATPELAPTEPAPTETAAPQPTATPEPPSPTATETATAVPTVIATPTLTPLPSPTPTPTERPAFPGQKASVGEGELPAQVFPAAEFRYTVETVARGATLEAAGLGPATLADWVVVVLHAQNWSEANASLAVSNFQLVTYGPYGIQGRTPDVVTGAVATNLGIEPALGAGEATIIAAGDGMRLALAYVIDPATTDLELQVAGTVIDLDAAVGQPVAINNLGDTPELPELIEGTVEKVVDTTTIMVQSAGARTRVGLIGVDGPLAGACFVDESLAVLAELSVGKTVYLERERSNRIDGILARDVWIVAEDGTLRLLAAELARAGAVVPAPSDPDVRYEGLIAAAGGEAEYTGAGLWSACGGLQAPPEPGDELTDPATTDPAAAPAGTGGTSTDPAVAAPDAAAPVEPIEQTIEPVAMVRLSRT